MKPGIKTIALCIILLSIACSSTPTQEIIQPSPTAITWTEMPAILPTETITNTNTPLPTLILTSTFTLQPTRTLTATITLASLTNDISCLPAGSEREIATVNRVIDGDTIEVLMHGLLYKVRYIGIDTPEVGEPYYTEATTLNAKLVSKHTITMIKDVTETDDYNRLLRYILVDGQFVNFELVNQGLAYSKSYPPDTSCQELFDGAQNNAASTQAGLWQPTKAPSTKATATKLSSCDPAYPDVCIPSPPPDLDCKDIPYRRFRVLSPDPHNFDGDGNGIGCEAP